MILQKIGNVLKKNTKTKVWWMKLGVCLILSNIFFFLLFDDDSELKPGPKFPGWVEVQLEAQLLTPFQSGKKVLLIQRTARKKLEGVLQANGKEEPGKITVLVKEEDAEALFHYATWEVLPFLRHLTFASIRKEAGHEIRY